jgi:superfamily II DNA helicase RecQ
MAELVQDSQQDNVQALQLGHNRRSHDRIYGISADALTGPPEDVMPLFLDTSVSWQMQVKVVPGERRSPSSSSSADVELNTGGLRLYYRAATMSSYQDLVDKGTISVPRDGANASIQAIADRVSTRIEAKLLGLVNDLASRPSPTTLPIISEDVPPPSPTIASNPSSPISSGGFERPSDAEDVHQAPVADGLCALMMLRRLIDDPQGGWTCDQQRDGVLAALGHQTDVLAIIKTGWGKSMLPIIPAMIEECRTTVIVLPLKSLVMDYRRKLQDMSVPFEHFSKESPRLKGEHNLVLVSADYAKSSAFRQALAIVNESRPVVRTCFDEGHFAHTSDHFRERALGRLYELRQFPDTQLIILSATVPEISVPALKEHFGLLDHTAIFRTSTSRPEIKYLLEPTRSKMAIYQRVDEILSDERPHLKVDDRMLIFVTYTEDGDFIANRQGCDFYSGASSITDAQRSAMYDRWRDGEKDVMVATSAFGTGNDYPHVRVVVHAGNPYDMMSYTQQKSRAGRDGRPAKSYILPRKLAVNTAMPTFTGPIDHKGVIPMQRWLHRLNDRRCSRHIITSFCDGEEGAVTCMEDPKSERCTTCERMHPVTSAVATPSTTAPKKRSGNDSFAEAHEMVKRRKVEVGDASDRFIASMSQALRSSHGRCAFCMVMDVEHVSYHTIVKCPSLGLARSSTTAYIRWRDDLHYNQDWFHGSICFKCHVPQMQDRLHGTYGAVPCEFPDVIAPTAFAIFSRHAQEAAAQFGVPLSTLPQFTSWLNSKPPQGSQSNMTDLFLWYHQSL